MTKKQQEMINRLIVKTVEADTTLETAKTDLINGLTQGLDKDDTKNIIIRERLLEAFDSEKKASVLYKEQLDAIRDAGITWKQVTYHLQTVIFASDYPMTDDKPVPVMKAYQDGSKSAAVINRFNSWRSSNYSDFDVIRVKTKVAATTDIDIVASEASENNAENRAEQAEAKKDSKPQIFNRESIPVALMFMYQDIENSENLELVAAVETLAEHYKLEL